MLVDKSNSDFLNVKICGINCQRLWYKVGNSTLNLDAKKNLPPGTLLKVPLQKKVYFGLVDNFSWQPMDIENTTFRVREVLAVVNAPEDPKFFRFMSSVARLYLVEVADLYTIFIDLITKCSRVQKKRVATHEQEANLQPKTFAESLESSAIILTAEQHHAVEALSSCIGKGNFSPNLLFGVTGSGKTEVYKKLIIAAAKKGLASIFLLPEIGLCEKFFLDLRELESFGIAVVRYHSAVGIDERRRVLQLLDAAQPVLLMGVHLPVFLPLKNLGLILVDEEHEQGFCRQSLPRIDSKQMAILRAQIAKLTIVLGSATPSVSTFSLAQKAPWQIFRLSKKLTESKRNITIASLAVKEKRANFWLTKKLEEAIALRLQRGEQSIIFLNRRGHSFFAQCKNCGFILQCKNCSVSLTVHRNNELTFVQCHYCSSREFCPTACADCKKNDAFLFKGVGTQQICLLLEKLFPQARIVRVDLDSASSKRDWPQKAKAIFQGKVDILVGTQSIAKSYHFPNVTLVGVIWADLDFNFPVYDAQEVALQRLLQVAGRTGRGDKPGQIILQVMKESKIFNELDEANYPEFMLKELAMREKIGFPPFKKFYQVQLQHEVEAQLLADAELLARSITNMARDLSLLVQVLGPFSPPVHKVCRMHIQELLVKGEHLGKISQLLRKLDLTGLASRVSFRLLF